MRSAITVNGQGLSPCHRGGETREQFRIVECAGGGNRAGANKPAKTGLLTPREQQILQWIYHGKSNIEIGMILEISPLTVKNHVQKTLRKLNVLNRTQAVGKALALRIVNP